jgi:hypothetical protein
MADLSFLHHSSWSGKPWGLCQAQHTGSESSLLARKGNVKRGPGNLVLWQSGNPEMATGKELRTVATTLSPVPAAAAKL